MEAFFRPRSIALVGASRFPGKIGRILWDKLRGYSGRLYPVNPKLGLARVTDIAGPVDLAVIAVPAPAVPSVVDDCVAKKVKGVIVISSGFNELGDKGVKLKAPPVPLLGPNCFGLANPKLKLDTTFAKAAAPAGNIGLISQSGALASYLFNWAKEESLGFSKFVSLGNRLGLNEIDFLEFLASDRETKIIALYLESFADGRRWLELTSRISRHKPMVVLFGGQTAGGARASLSHTASVSPPAALIRTAVNQPGAILAEDLEDFTNLLEVFSLAPALAGEDLAIITNAGGPAILAADTAGSLAFKVARPIDLLGDALTEDYDRAIRSALKDRVSDAVLVIITPQANTDITQIAQAIVKRFKQSGKPIVVSLLGGRLAEPARKILRSHKIATIDLPQQAAQSLAALLSFHRRKKNPPYPVRRPYRLRHQPSGTLPEGRLTWLQAAKLARGYRLPLVETVKLTQPVKPQSLSWPVVIKADPALSQHRTENKAIHLNIHSVSAFKKSYQQISRNFPLVLGQSQLTSGHELFVGIRREANWPPLLTLGGGGVYTELYQDLARAFLPVNAAVINQLLRQTRIGQIINGYRTGLKLALNEVVKLILNSCRLFEENPQISELEINPAIVTETAVTIVDLKLTAGEPSGTLPEG